MNDHREAEIVSTTAVLKPSPNNGGTALSVPLVKIYGERNSGTIYLSELIRLNFVAKELRGFVPWPVTGLQLILPGRESVRDAFFSATFGSNLGWKHMRVKPVEELQQYGIASRRLHFLTITKNPYSWLLSMHRRPYHQYYDSGLSFEEFLTTPWQTTRRDGTEQTIENPIQLWNVKNRSYLPLNNVFPALNLRYEDVLCDPEQAMSQVESEFQLQRTADGFRNFQQSTKDTSKDSDYYRDYYLNERWRDKLSAAAIEIINKHLDQTLVKTFGYGMLSNCVAA
jgi:hypothetical protein